MNKLWILLLILFYSYSNANSPYGIPDYFPLRLYQIMKDAHEVLELYDIPYWIHAGTLLGAVRHGGIIPWDDDLDIVIAQKDKQRFLDILSHFESLGYIITQMPFGYKIVGTVEGQKHTCLDVMIFVQNDKKRYCYPKECGMNQNVIYFSESELFPLKPYQFGELTVMGPQNPLPYLHRVYKKWDTQAVIWNHLTVSSYTKPLTEELKKPAQPTGPLKDRVYQTLATKGCPLQPVIDQARPEDAQDLQKLLVQLGFPTATTTMCREKIEQIAQNPLDKIWTVKLFDEIIGFVCLNIITPFYHPELFARVDSIVVDQRYQKCGIGKLLMQLAEDYAQSIGCQRVFLTSGNHRQWAHDFYHRLGYVTNATYFVKYLH